MLYLCKYNGYTISGQRGLRFVPSLHVPCERLFQSYQFFFAADAMIKHILALFPVSSRAPGTPWSYENCFCSRIHVICANRTKINSYHNIWRVCKAYTGHEWCSSNGFFPVQLMRMCLSAIAFPSFIENCIFKMGCYMEFETCSRCACETTSIPLLPNNEMRCMYVGNAGQYIFVVRHNSRSLNYD